MFSESTPLISTSIAKLVYNVAPYRKNGLFFDVKNFPDVETVYTRNIDRGTSFVRLDLNLLLPVDGKSKY